MVQFSNLNFSTSLGVIYELKQKYNHQKLSETYQMLSNSDIDSIIEVLNISYNKANKTNLSIDDFAQLLDDNNIGFLKLGDIFGKVVEAIMFNGLTPEEVEERKNLLMNLKK